MSERVGYPPRGVAPIMGRDDRPPGPSHWCSAVGGRVHAAEDRCPYCSDQEKTDD